jgi:hypothetical protein
MDLKVSRKYTIENLSDLQFRMIYGGRMKRLLWRIFVFTMMIPCYLVMVIGIGGDWICEKLTKITQH